MAPNRQSNITKVPSDDEILGGGHYENLEKYLKKIQFSGRHKHIGEQLIKSGSAFPLNRLLQLVRVIALFDAIMHHLNGISAILDMATGTENQYLLASMILS